MTNAEVDTIDTDLFHLQAPLLQQLSHERQGSHFMQALYRIHNAAIIENRIAEAESKRFDFLFAVEAYFHDWMCG